MTRTPSIGLVMLPETKPASEGGQALKRPPYWPQSEPVQTTMTFFGEMSSMDVQQAVQSRKSVRDFLDTPVSEATLRQVIETATRAPSGGNLQPWHLHVVTGDALARLKTLMREKVSKGFNEVPEYEIYPPKLQSPYRDRRFEIGELMY